MYEVVTNEGPNCLFFEWLNTAKLLNDKLNVKSRLVAKSFQEKKRLA